ncbi:MAG: flavodoxin-dependent (E)-4-hydroxy-3-methylbut-2-enyl-diphosphate synthase [Planctomycetota bacterium]
MSGGRRKTRVVKVGNVLIGGNNPIVVQSMTTCHPAEIEKTVEEIEKLEQAGCEIVRVAIPDKEAVEALPYIKRRIKIPLVADIHFNASLAFAVVEKNCIDKIRINPGNIPRIIKNPFTNMDVENLKNIAIKIKEKGIPVRIGVNSGSLDKELLNKYGYPTPDALVECAIRAIETFESVGHRDIVISIKSTDLFTFWDANRKLAKMCDYPLHLGVTEAGTENYGIIKSSIGIGVLLSEGIGDTIRVSLVGDSVKEIDAGYNILKALQLRYREPEIIACPTCGRINVDLEKIVKDIDNKIKIEQIKRPIKISVLGCAVNGPGEATYSNFGIACGDKEGLLYKEGKIVKKVPQEKLAEELIKLIKETNPSN